MGSRIGVENEVRQNQDRNRIYIFVLENVQEISDKKAVAISFCNETITVSI